MSHSILTRTPSPRTSPLRFLALTAAVLAVGTACEPAGDLDDDGFTTEAGDCDDADATSYPGATELCDDKDNDCNGVADDSGYYYADTDGDGAGNQNVEVADCKKPSGYVEVAGDCDDTNPNTRPGATELCDFKDNNCDGQVDENLISGIFYRDEDGDDYGVRTDIVEGCEQPNGYADEEGDCDDANPQINPGENETCDALDNNCSGLVDEGYPIAVVYPDTDNDTYGADVEGITACATAEGYSILNADCDDTETTTNPSAPERCDGIDNNCNAVVDENLRFRFFKDEDGDGFGNEEVETCNPSSDEVEARGDCNDADLSVHPGALDPGNDNKDSDCGGTDFPEPHVYLSSTSTPFLKTALFAAQDGETVWVGPGVILDGDLGCYGKKIRIKSTHLSDRTLIDAGGFSRVFLFTDGDDSSCEVDGFTMTNGYREDVGGGIYILNASPNIHNNKIVGNYAPQGGGIYITGSGAATLSNNIVVNNTAVHNGAGITINDAEPKLSNNLIIGNRFRLGEGRAQGGGVGIFSARPNLINNTIVGNSAAFGGGVWISGTSASPTIQNTIIAFNTTDNVYQDGGSAAFAYSVLHNNGFDNHNLSALPSTCKTTDPGLIDYTNGMDVSLADFHLRPASGLRNAGNPATFNPDDSRADIGAYGGSTADMSAYGDKDEDGLYDAWEFRNGFLASVANGNEDPDIDGLTNLEELNAGSNPNLADSDGDGEKDGVEVDAGANPQDWYSRAATPAGITVKVPGDFDTLQAAIDQIRWAGDIELSNALNSESVVISSAVARIQSKSGVAVSFSSTEGPLFTTQNAILSLKEVTFNGATAIDGPAVRMTNSRGHIDTVTFTNNTAQGNGGALYAFASAPHIMNSLFTDNTATMGGALYFKYSRPTLDDVELSNNIGELGGAIANVGSGMALLNNVQIDGNVGIEGAGLYASDSSTTELIQCEIFENEGLSETDSGTGIFASQSASVEVDRSKVHSHRANRGAAFAALSYGHITVRNSEAYDNIATDIGGAAWVDGASFDLVNSAFYDNLATNSGAGIYLYESPVTVTNSVLVNNICGVRGGAIMQEGLEDFWYYTEELTITNSVLAWNVPDNLHVYVYDGVAEFATVKYSDLYNPGSTNTNLPVVDSSNLNVDPAFVTYDSENGSYDFHLQSGSPLIDAGDPTVKDLDNSRSDIGLYGGPGARP